jgi:hypothetical protein
MHWLNRALVHKRIDSVDVAHASWSHEYIDVWCRGLFGMHNTCYHREANVETQKEERRSECLLMPYCKVQKLMLKTLNFSWLMSRHMWNKRVSFTHERSLLQQSNVTPSGRYYTIIYRKLFNQWGVRLRRSGGGLGGGCARMPTDTHPRLLVVVVDNPKTVPCLARLGARRGETQKLWSTRSTTIGKPRYGGLLEILYVHLLLNNIVYGNQVATQQYWYALQVLHW